MLQALRPRSCRPRWSSCSVGIAAVVGCSISTTHGVAIVGTHPVRAAHRRRSDAWHRRLPGRWSVPQPASLLIGFAEGLGAAKTYAATEGYDVDANAELLGLGVANVGAGLVGGHGRQRQPVQDRRQRRGRSESQLSGLFVAVLTIVTLLFLTGLFEQLPEASLAAVVDRGRHRAGRHRVAFAASTACGPAGSAAIYRHAARVDFIAAVAAMLGVLVFDTLPGLFIGIVDLAAGAAVPIVAAARRHPCPDTGAGG